MSTRAQPRCSHCHNTGHNRRTCNRLLATKKHLSLIEKELSSSKRVVILPKIPNCAVCQESIMGEKDSMCLPCGHKFHVTCGLKWLQENNSCPCCRAEVGDKPKKLPVLTSRVSLSLVSETLNSDNSVINASQENQAICEQPWTYPGYKQYVFEDDNFIDYSDQELKEKWDAEPQATQIRLKCRFLYQHNASIMGNLMLKSLSAARQYQEGDFDLSEVLTDEPEGDFMSITIPSTTMEMATMEMATTVEPIDIFDSSEDDEEDNDSMPDLETSSLHDLEEDTSQFAMVSPENGFDNQYERNDDDVGWRIDRTGGIPNWPATPPRGPMTMDELRTVSDDDSDTESDDDILNYSLEREDTVMTPSPTLPSVPDAPSRRSNLQSPTPPTVSRALFNDDNVTRRTSARIAHMQRRALLASVEV